MSKLIFEEKQRFNQWWLWLIILGSFAFITMKIFKSGTLSENLPPALILFSVVILFLIINLRTKIDEVGIHIKMFPFHFNPVTYKWNDIHSVKVREYSPLFEYGGWGIRIGPNGKAFNIKGNKGIEIKTAKGKTRMIGTQKMEEAQKTIDQYLNN